VLLLDLPLPIYLPQQNVFTPPHNPPQVCSA
jgi:hypothetical protein